VIHTRCPHLSQLSHSSRATRSQDAVPDRCAVVRPVNAYNGYTGYTMTITPSNVGNGAGCG
jgi:hypothetical protein